MRILVHWHFGEPAFMETTISSTQPPQALLCYRSVICRSDCGGGAVVDVVSGVEDLRKNAADWGLVYPTHPKHLHIHVYMEKMIRC